MKYLFFHFFVLLASCSLCTPTILAGEGSSVFDVAGEITHGPAGMVIAPDGSIIVSLHQTFAARERVVRINRNGEWEPFPNAEISMGEGQSMASLDSVMGIRIHDNIVWMLDNGRRGETTPKVVGWNISQNKLHRVFPLLPPVTLNSSLLADLAVDPLENFIYITDPASGDDAAIIVLNLDSGDAWRVLQGHQSVVPEDIPLRVGGKILEVRRPDGSGAEPLAGVNPIAIDHKGRQLYFGPMKGLSLYHMDVGILRDPTAQASELERAVGVYSSKPVCDAITIDGQNNIYAADLTRSSIKVIRPKTKKMEDFAKDPQLCWPDGLCFGGDGRLYFYCNQLSRSAWYNAGTDHSNAPFSIYRIKPLPQPFITNPLSGRIPFSEQISERWRRLQGLSN